MGVEFDDLKYHLHHAQTALAKYRLPADVEEVSVEDILRDIGEAAQSIAWVYEQLCEADGHYPPPGGDA